MGKLRIGYRETLPQAIKKGFRLTKQINKQEMWLELELELVPVKEANDSYRTTNEVVVSFPRTPEFDRSWVQYLKRKNILKARKQATQDSD